MKDNPFGAGLVVFADIMKQYVGFFKKFPKTVGSITLAVLIYIFVPILGPYLNKVMIDRASYNFAYNLNPFWDDRVVVGVVDIGFINQNKDFEKTDLNKSKYLTFPTSKEIYEQELFLNRIHEEIPGLFNKIVLEKNEEIIVSTQKEIFRTIDDKIVLFKNNTGKIFILDETDYKNLLKENFTFQDGKKDIYGKIGASEKKKNTFTLPENFKELPLFAYFENEFDMTDENKRYLLTLAATLNDEKKDELIKEIKTSFYDYKKEKSDYRNMIKNMPNHLLRPEDIEKKNQYLEEDKKGI